MTSNAHGITLFQTQVGSVGIAFTHLAIAGIQLPEADDASTIARLRTIIKPRYLAAFEVIESKHAPVHARSAIDEITAHLSGKLSGFVQIKLDYTGFSDFRVRLFDLARAIPNGEVRTYGQLAHALGSPGSARAIGRAMATNPYPIVVPCHRVIGTSAPAARRGNTSESAFRPGGFSAYGGLTTKARLLEIERAPLAGAMAHAAATSPTRAADFQSS